jgi:hypothetical protein
MHRSRFPTAFAVSTSTHDFKAGTYHGVLVSLRNVLHFVSAGVYSRWFGRRMIALSELCCEIV